MLRADPTPRRARVGVSVLFFTNGVILSALLPRLPEVKADFGLSNSGFGLLVVAFPAGAILAAAFSGVAVRRFGTLRVTAVGSVALAAALAVAGAAPAVWLFALAMLVGGAVDAVVDAAQNVQGVLVEHWVGRSVLNSLHALWSVGAATGGLIGAGGAALEVDLGLQMAVSGAVWAAAAVLASALSAVPAEVRVDEDAAEPGPGRPAAHAWRLLLPLVVLAVCGTLVEDVANNWVVLFLGEEAGAPAAVAGLGLTVMIGAQFVGRITGDPLTDRFGRDRVASAGGLLIAGGALVVVVAPAYPLAFAGFALAGFGCATLVPAAFAAAGRVPGLPEGSGIAVVSWLMRIGFLLTSPVIGVVSDATSLRVAMVVPLLAGLVAAGLAARLRRAALRS